MNDIVSSETELYSSYKTIVDDGLNSYIEKLSLDNAINHHSIYSITFENIIHKNEGGKIKASYIFNDEENYFLNNLFEKIINEHPKLKAINKYGRDSKMCFETYLRSFRIFFKIVE
jgi:hypothetical protein